MPPGIVLNCCLSYYWSENWNQLLSKRTHSESSHSFNHTWTSIQDAFQKENGFYKRIDFYLYSWGLTPTKHILVYYMNMYNPAFLLTLHPQKEGTVLVSKCFFASMPQVFEALDKGMSDLWILLWHFKKLQAWQLTLKQQQSVPKQIPKSISGTHPKIPKACKYFTQNFWSSDLFTHRPFYKEPLADSLLPSTIKHKGLVTNVCYINIC